MATTTVRRGTKRPAADAKREKAAQRTALPVKDAEPQPTDNLDAMSLTELRTLMTAQGWSTGTKGSKRELIALLRKHPDGPPKAAKARSSVDDVESKPSAQVDPQLCREIGERMVTERKRFTRATLAEATNGGLSASQVWRCEQSRPRPDELHIIEALFARIDSGELVPPVKPAPFGGVHAGPSKRDLTNALGAVESLLAGAPVGGKTTVTELRKIVAGALDIIERAQKSE